MSNHNASRGISSSTPPRASSSALVARAGFLIVVACLLVFGLVMLYSASSIYSYNVSGDYTTTFSKQTIFVALGVGLALIIALVPYRAFSLPLCAGALIITIPLLILVLTDGSDALGARRWIDLGFTTLQPSEFTKIALILVMAHLVHRCREHGYSKPLIILMIIACVIPIGLIVVEPDLGTTIIAVFGILAVLWFGGVPKRIVALLCLGLVVLAAFAILGTGFRQSRIEAWLNPWSDPQVTGYQLIHSYYAFGGGGVFGVGLGLSRQKFTWLPQSENDFVFAIIGEELGLIGAFVVVLLFVALVFMALRIARNAPDALGAMIAGSSGAIIGLQAFLNMLCVIGALPTTGKPLPFFSAGGSSIITTMILVGLVLSVSMQSSQTDVYDFKREQFVIVPGGGRQGSRVGDRASILSRIPNPAALVSALLPRQQVPEQRRSYSGISRDGRALPGGKAVYRGHGSPASSGRNPALHRTTPSGGAVPSARTGALRTGSSSTAPLRTGSSRLAASTTAPLRAVSSRTALTDKVVPISRGRAERTSKEQQSLRRAQEAQQTSLSHRRDGAPVSMASLRRNRVRRAGSGGNSA